MVLYLLDANVLINANRTYYSIDRVPEFWEWLVYMGGMDKVKIPIEIYEEIDKKRPDEIDFLADWAKEVETKSALLLKDEVDVLLVASITNVGYADDLTDNEVEKLGRDPFLIAHALKDTNSRCVVTSEVSKPNKQRANRRIPDVCSMFKVPCCDTFDFVRALNFSTHWKDFS
jgi:hypothetical protein